MAKQNKKTGAARKDKYYMLAKAQGYRARSAFKLIHLNRKYDLLGKSKVVIDLCAAPGGWLQVAEKYCPKQSLLVGVDLDPIKAIPNCTTFVNDITTASCRNQLRAHLKHFQADLVMHDGAPNVGTAWVQDAFTQSELVLQSLKLATEFLKKGGAFVTKVFRSGDYNSLMWVFNQLFSKVEATKPPSSRNVSAEIFVVCQDFLAPKYIDPKFLDPKHVFKELAQNTAALPQSILSNGDSEKTRLTNPGMSLAIQGQATNVFAPEKKKRQREGYAEGDYTLYRSINVRDFINSPTIDDAMRVLSTCNAMTFDLSDSAPDAEKQKAWAASRHTTDDVKRDLEDLKVLGKGDFKKLMKWRLSIRLEVGLEVRKKDEEDATDKVEIEEDVDEEQVVTEEMARLRAEAMTKAKREKRKANEKKARTIQRLHLNMTAPEDMTMEDDLALAGEDVFDLGQGEKEIKRRGGKATLDAALRDADGMDESEVEDEEEEEEEEFLDSDDEREARTSRLEGALDGLYETYQDRMKERDAKWKVKQARLRDRNQDSWHGVRQGSDDEDERIVKVQGYNDDDNDSEAESEGGWDHVAKEKAKIGEEVDSSDDDSDSVMSDEDEDKPKVKKVRLALPGRSTAKAAPTRKAGSLVANLGADVQKAELSMAAQVWFDQSVFKGVGDLADLDVEEEPEEEEEEDVEMEAEAEDDDFEVVPIEKEDGIEWDVEDEDQDVVKQEKIKKKGLLTGEAVTLASALVNRQTTASQMIDDGFNRHNFNHKDGLPTWFLDDEGKHWKANLPVTKEAMDALRAKQRALDARPIKKVAEAKARKKFKAHQRLEKAKKKAEGLLDAPDMSEKERANQMLKTLGKAGAKPKQKEVKVVVARGANKGLKGRPKGVKGRYKIVDARMRKEMRAMKRKTKATKKKRN